MGRAVRMLSVAGLLLAAAAASAVSTACAPAASSPDGSPVSPATSSPATSTAATAEPSPTRLVLESAWTGLSQPVQLTHAADGSGRLFVVELGGRVRVIDGGRLLPTPFLDISRLVSTGGERGLLSVAFAPGPSGATFYVDYTDVNGDSIVARYRVTGSDRNVADPSSARVVLKVKQPFPNHNGGQLAFGPDGYLYVGFGDGGGAGDPNGNGQNPGVLLGKILRLDVSGSGGYKVPPTNPFVGRPGFRPEIWDLGLRNPWRFSFDRETGDLYIGDVGQNKWEEVDYEPAASGGRNYGWNLYEGTHPYAPGGSQAPGTTLTPPVTEYGHDVGDAVTGGFVYRGSRWPTLRGTYLFSDSGSGRIWMLSRKNGAWVSRVALDTGRGIAGFGEDENGELYVLDLNRGEAWRVTLR